MSYTLEAFIGKTADLQILKNTYKNAVMVELKQDFSLIPMTEELFTEMMKLAVDPSTSGLSLNFAQNNFPYFNYLNPEIEKTLLKLTAQSTIGYLEADYYNEEGGQIAVLWQNGLRTKTYEFSNHAIDFLLKDLKVAADSGKDQFDTLELGKNRKTENWLIKEPKFK